MNKKHLNIALIDSGVELNRDEFTDAEIIPITLINSNNFDDNIGHGTAIAFLIYKLLPTSTIYSIKIFEKSYETTENDLYKALEYIEKFLMVDIIHISSGIIGPENIKKLSNICNRFKKKNVVIVSSYDNLGVVSYPAALPCVIGVYWDKYCTNVNDYKFIKNSTINILGYGSTLRLPWKGNTYKSVAGSSFSSPYITGLIGSIILEGIISWDDIIKEVEKRASSIISLPVSNDFKFNTYEKDIKKIGRVITFPLNKEIHAILANRDLLNFSFESVYDIPQYSRIGRNIREVIYGNDIADLTIKSFYNIDWTANFDTVILGHTSLISKILNVEFISHFLDNCIKFKKNIYCFDNIELYEDKINAIRKNGNFVIYFHMSNNDIHINTFGSLNKINKPVLGIFGTSPQQGKFNLQLCLRRNFISKNYSVGQFGTEPSSLLFGMDATLPTGYESGIDLSPQKEVYFINSQLSKIIDKDIIIVGSQSQSIPYNFGNLGFYTFSQHHLLLASEPDAIILCINPNDNINYIKKTITYFKCYFDSEVIALVLYPFYKDGEWNIQNNNSKKLSIYELSEYKNKYENIFNIPIYINGNNNDEMSLTERCIEFFS